MTILHWELTAGTEQLNSLVIWKEKRPHSPTFHVLLTHAAADITFAHQLLALFFKVIWAI